MLRSVSARFSSQGMPQLEDLGVYMFIDPVQLIARGFEVSAKINDVILVEVDKDGMDFQHILTTICYNGTVAEWGPTGARTM